jgi:hypothetical protein
LFIRHQSDNLVLAIRRRQQRDLFAIQRIIINVGLLVVLGFPGVMVLMMALITGIEHPLSYRILWTGCEIAATVLSVEMVFMTPQLKHIVMRKWRQNRVTIIQGSMQMRPVAVTQ